MEMHLLRLLEDLGVPGTWPTENGATLEGTFENEDGTEQVVKLELSHPTTVQGSAYWRNCHLSISDAGRVGWDELRLNLSDLPEIAIAGVVYAYTRL